MTARGRGGSDAVSTYGFLLPGGFLLELVVQKIHGFPANRWQWVPQQPSNHRNERFCGQQGIDLESSLHLMKSEIRKREINADSDRPLLLASLPCARHLQTHFLI